MPREGSTRGGPAEVSAAFTTQESLLLCLSKEAESISREEIKQS